MAGVIAAIVVGVIVLAFIIFPLNRLKEQPKIDGLNGYVGIFVPGESPMVFPEGTAKSRLRLAQAKLSEWLAPLSGEPV